MNTEHMEELCHRSRNFSAVIEGLTKRIRNLQQQPVKNREDIKKRLKEMEKLTKKFDRFIVEFEQACELDDLSIAP